MDVIIFQTDTDGEGGSVCVCVGGAGSICKALLMLFSHSVMSDSL